MNIQLYLKMYPSVKKNRFKCIRTDLFVKNMFVLANSSAYVSGNVYVSHTVPFINAFLFHVGAEEIQNAKINQ